MAESKMPERIWSGPELVAATRTWGMHNYDETPAANVPFIRADLVEPLVEALRCLPVEWLKSGVAADSRSDGLRIEMRIVGTTYKSEITVGDLRSARTALSSWEAGQSGQAQTEARG